VSLFRRVVREEQRAITDLPWSTGGTLSTTVSVDRALSLVPVYAAIGLLARTVSCTPLHAYRRVDDEERRRVTLPALFLSMDTEAHLKTWLHQAVVSLATRGNLYGLVTSRDGFGYPTAVTWLNPTAVTVEDQNTSGPGSLAMPIWRWHGRQIHVGPADAATSDIIHVPWFPIPGQIEGLSPLGVVASMIATGINAQDYASEWFANGGIPPGTMKNTARTLLPEEADAVKGRLVSTIRSRKPLVYGSDWDYNPIALPPNDAQFVETAKLTATQVAAIFDVPPDRIGGELGGPLTYSSPEQAALHLVTFSLRNWFELFEETFSAMIPRQQYIKFNADSLVRADIKTRHEVYKTGRSIGLYCVDELRALEDRPPLADHALGQDYTPLAVAFDDLPDPEPNADPTVRPQAVNPKTPKAAKAPQASRSADRPADGQNRKDVD
jgi:HK97 family phage portal protein